MAFFRKAGNMLGRTVSNYMSQEISSSKPYIFQAIRCMSSSKLFIGGLSFSTNDASLMEAFSKYGNVAEARVIVERETGRSRGFGFVTYSSVEEASAAMQALDQQELHGRRIRVDYANDRVRGYGGGGGFRGGNFGGGSGGGYNSGGSYGGSYGGGTGSQGSTNYASNSSYGGGNLSYGGDGQNLGIGGGGASNNFYSSGASAGGGGGGEQTNYMADAGEGFRPDDSLDENHRDDDDTPDNRADRRS